jgi:hypothetical protein
LRWDNSLKIWAPFSGSQGALLQWDAVDGWQAFSAPPPSGKYVLGSIEGALSWSSTSDASDSLSFLPDKPVSGKHVLGLDNGTLVWLPTEEC